MEVSDHMGSPALTLGATALMRTITICAHRRPDYLEQVLDSLVRALNCCPEYKPDRVLIGIDPEPYYGLHDRVARCISQCDNRYVGYEFESFVWPHHLGVSEHPRRLLQWVFASGSDFNLHLEDDTVLSPDALRLAMWYYLRSPILAPDSVCLSLHSNTSWNPEIATVQLSRPLINRVLKRADFGVWGWACNAYNWREHIHPTWNHKREGKLGWDWSLSHTIHKNNLTVVSPALSRVHNIGRENGCHQTAEGYDLEQAGAVWADSSHVQEINAFVLDPAQPIRQEWTYGD